MDYKLDSYIPSFVYMVDRHANEDYYIPPESRKHHNLMIIVSGEGYYLDGEKEIPIKKNDVVYNKPNQIYGYRTSKDNLLHAYGINFDVAAIKMEHEREWTLEMVDRLPFEHIFSLHDLYGIQKLLKDMVDQWLRNKVSYNNACRKIMLDILDAMVNQLQHPDEHRKKQDVVQNAIAYMENNYDKPITLVDICRHVSLTASYFGKLFKNVTGRTPIEFLQVVRIERAEELLIQRYPVNEIATMTGFQNPFYFSKVFKRYKGQCPRDYMRAATKIL